MKIICDLKDDEMVIGLKIKSLISPNTIGEVVSIDKDDDNFVNLIWTYPDGSKREGGFYFYTEADRAYQKKQGLSKEYNLLNEVIE